MSFIYPRVVAIRRPKADAGVGDQGYSAERGVDDEDEVLSGLPASIQIDRQGQANALHLPADAKFQPIWKVFIPLRAAARGAIKSTDIVVDDAGSRYQVFAPYWNSLGYQLRCIILEV